MSDYDGNLTYGLDDFVADADGHTISADDDEVEDDDYWCEDCDVYLCRHGVCPECEGCEVCDPDTFEEEASDGA